MSKIIVTRKSKKSKWYWKIVATNGKTLCNSETYSSRAKAYQTALVISELTGVSLAEVAKK